jgi:F0F1-type ATP synthase membrane subunit b/b'
MVTDSVLFWVNLLVVILLILKFAAKPFMDLLRGRGKEKAADLSRLEAEKKKLYEEIAKTNKMIDEKKAIIVDSEEDIIKKGETIKAGIIREAGIESDKIIEKAVREAEQKAKEAAEKLRAEVINEIFDKQPGNKKD